MKKGVRGSTRWIQVKLHQPVHSWRNFFIKSQVARVEGFKHEYSINRKEKRKKNRNPVIFFRDSARYNEGESAIEG